MIHVYRYGWVGVDLILVNRSILPAFPATLIDLAPTSFIDLQTDDTAKEDLDAIMSTLGWIFVSTDPTGLPSGTDPVLTFGAGTTLLGPGSFWLVPGNSDLIAGVIAVEMVMPRAGTLRDLSVLQNSLGIGSGQTLFYTVFLNGAPTALTTSILDTLPEGQDLVNTVAVAAGDKVSLRVNIPIILGAAPSLIVATMSFGSN